MRSPRSNVALLLAFVLVAGAEKTAWSDESKEPTPNSGDRWFLDEIKPLLAARCLSCHGPDNAEGNLRLDTREAALHGGDSGAAIVPGRPDESLLFMAVRGTHEELKMPPQDKLAADEIAAVERWIVEGAPWPQDLAAPIPVRDARGERIGDAWTDSRNPIVRLFGGDRLDLWSLKPVQRVAAPDIKTPKWAKNDIDRFVLASLEQDQIPPPEMADSLTLGRRLHFDLTGLPPTRQQVIDFDARVSEVGSDAAVAELVNLLLSRPQFGEHFARMWLDVVRYSDSNGFDWDEFRPQAWRYRDYVVRSFNADKPFDLFIREQLAGDELLEGPPRTAAEQDCLIATGFLRLGPHDNAAPLFDEQDRSRAELLADVTETTASAFLGVTLSCCRCHDHKYDPLSQADHYRFRAFFAAVRFADDLPIDLADEQQAVQGYNARFEGRTTSLREQLSKLPDSNEAERQRLQRELDAIEEGRRSFTTALVMTDACEDVPVTHVLFQGDHKAPRDAVEPGFLSIFDPQPAKVIKPVNPTTSGRRLTLANWIASPHNPLTARVFVNRVWGQLMGRPLVSTPNDFGLAGSRPENSALLDWLACELVQQSWSVKSLVRLIATSASYRQAPSFARAHAFLRTPRRLSAEQLRDALLHTSGLLTDKAEGPPVWPDLPAEILESNPAFLDDNAEKTKGWYPSPLPDQYCRSLYLVQKRNIRVPLLESFDLPDNSVSCPHRETSTIAPQALMLLNNSLAVEASRAFAERVEREVGDDPQRQVEHAFELALQRRPEILELADCQRLLAHRSLAELCRVLVNLNEFAYID